MYFTTAAVILCGGITLWYLLTFNLLVRSRNAVDQAWSNIEVELKRRFDLIQNLVETAQGYAHHESDTFRKLTELRAQNHPFQTAAAANSLAPKLTQAIRQVFLLAENYPQLQADQAFLQLQSELADTENRVALRRHAYNQTVNLYQNRCQFVPSNLVAQLHAFPARSFFDAPDELAAGPPAVTLS